MSRPATWAVIPVKPLRGGPAAAGRRRSRPPRRELQAAMLADVLGACAAAAGLAGVLVVTADPAGAARCAARQRARGSVPDHDPPRGA